MRALLARLPSREAIATARWARPLRHVIAKDALWTPHRRGLKRGIAIGLFCSTVAPLGQAFVAALLCFRMNGYVPIAVAACFVTNPLTMPFFYVAALRIGGWITGTATTEVFRLPQGRTAGEFLTDLGDWITAATGPLAVGMIAIGAAMAVTGFVAVEIAWRLQTRRRRRARLASGTKCC